MNWSKSACPPECFDKRLHLDTQSVIVYEKALKWGITVTASSILYSYGAAHKLRA